MLPLLSRLNPPHPLPARGAGGMRDGGAKGERPFSGAVRTYGLGERPFSGAVRRQSVSVRRDSGAVDRHAGAVRHLSKGVRPFSLGDARQPV